jgi:multicomponent Na+:H+ antiporter subunit F
MSLVLNGTMLALAVALALVTFRVVRGPSAPDRVMALDLATVVVVAMVAVYSAASNEPQLLQVAMGVALVSFIGTVTLARYLERARPAARRRAMAPQGPAPEERR